MKGITHERLKRLNALGDDELQAFIARAEVREGELATGLLNDIVSHLRACLPRALSDRRPIQRQLLAWIRKRKRPFRMCGAKVRRKNRPDGSRQYRWEPDSSTALLALYHNEYPMVWEGILLTFDLKQLHDAGEIWMNEGRRSCAVRSCQNRTARTRIVWHHESLEHVDAEFAGYALATYAPAVAKRFWMAQAVALMLEEMEMDDEGHLYAHLFSYWQQFGAASMSWSGIYDAFEMSKEFTALASQNNVRREPS